MSKMAVRHIKVSGLKSGVGISISEEDGGFRIWRRYRNKERPVPVHKADVALYPTFAAARQAVDSPGKDFSVNVEK